MTKRHTDPRLFLLGSVPTQDDIHIATGKLPTNKQVLLAFIAKKEEFDQAKKKAMFKAAMSITTEQILPIYARARIPTKHANKTAHDIVQHYYRSTQNLMKIKKEKRETGEAKERTEAFKKCLQKNMACWPKDVRSRLSNTEDKAFFVSMHNECTASIAGKDTKTHKLEMRQQKKKELQLQRLPVVLTINFHHNHLSI